MKAFLSIFTVALLSLSSLQAKSLLVKINLSPAGSFEIKSKSIVGKIVRVGDTLKASKLTVKVKKLKTGLGLRDDHLHKKLGKSSKITITDAVAVKGKMGTAKITVKGKTQPIKFKFTDKGSKVLIKFNLMLSKFGITGINYAGVGVKDKVAVQASLPVK